MQSAIDSRLNDRIQAFVTDISEIVREAAVDAVQEALTGETGPRAATRGRRPGRKKRKAVKRVSRKSKGKRVRRSAAELEALSTKFLAHVKANPGQRLEEIGAALGIPTSELKRPVALLLEAKKVRTTGQRRGTKYFAGSAKAKPTRTKPTARKKKKRKATKRA